MPPQDSLNSSDIKEHLYDYLEVISNGTFATSGTLSKPSNPGIFVEGLGKVGLPLSERDAVELARISHEAPFGKGNETIVDPSVRRTWELNPGQFRLRNPSWPTTVQEAIKKVADELGVLDGATSIKAELHKMLLYEPGAFFDTHRDTEKAPGMFATLVIALPSEHTGGDVVVQLGQVKQTLKTEVVSDFDYSYLAWYADVDHSVEKVQSGYRFVLTYNLVHVVSSSSRKASNLDDHKSNLSKVLALWNGQIDKDDVCYEKLVYMLEHEYSEANICLEHLKGKDQLRTRYLMEACREQDFCFFFAHFQHSKSGSCDEDEDDPYAGNADFHELMDVLDMEWKLETVFKLNGEVLAEDMKIEEKELIQENSFDEIQPDDEEFEGWTGNEGTSATHFYHRTCVVILPRAFRFDFLSEAVNEGNANIETWVGTLLQEMDVEVTSGAAKRELERLCSLITTNSSAISSGEHERQRTFQNDSSTSRVSDEDLGALVKAAMRLNSPNLLEDAAKAASKMLPLDVFEKLGYGLAERDITLWENGLKIAISRIPKFSERVEAFDKLVGSYKSSTTVNNAATANVEQPEHLLSHCLLQIKDRDVSVSTEDVKALIDLAIKFGERYMFQEILPFVKNKLTDVNFSIAFLTALYEAAKSSVIRLGVVQNIYKDILNEFTAEFEVSYKEIKSKVQRCDHPKRSRFTYRDYGPMNTQQHDTGLMTADHLAKIIRQCEVIKLPEEIDGLLNVMSNHAHTVDIAAFEMLLLPLLKLLPPVFEQQGMPLTTEQYQNLFQMVLNAYVQRYVQREPEAPRTWARQARGCGCEDCTSLDCFLTNPDRLFGRFCMPGKRRDHLEQQLQRSYCRVETERAGSPFTLMVWKTLGEWEHELSEWKQRCDTALKTFDEIGHEKLRGLLKDRYNETVELKTVKLSATPGAENSAGLNSREGVSVSQPLQGRQPLLDRPQANQEMSVVGKASEKCKPAQSKAEIINLCDDED